MGLLAYLMDKVVTFPPVPLEEDIDAHAYLRRRSIIDFAKEAKCDPVLLSACMDELVTQQEPKMVYPTFNDHAGAALIMARSMSRVEQCVLINKHYPVKELQI